MNVSWLICVGLLSGCYAGVRGTLNTPVRADAGAAGAASGALDLGFVVTSQDQSLGILGSYGYSPLVAEDGSARRLPIFSGGLHYEHDAIPRLPGIRPFAQVMAGRNPCTPSQSAPPSKPSDACSNPARMRDLSAFTLALGVVVTATELSPKDEMEPGIASVGLAVVYTAASDAALGSAEFLGLELSLGVGLDVFTPMMKKHD